MNTTIGEEFEVDFLKNHSGGRPVGRVNGKVAFIDKTVKDIIAPGSTHICAVVSIHERFVTVKPLYQIRTPLENTQIEKEKIENLQKLSKKYPPKEKVKETYKYMSLQELKQQ